jgi:hypothetical protein
VAEFYWLGGEDDYLGEVLNYVTGDFEGPAASALPVEGDTVFHDGNWAIVGPGSGTSPANWSMANLAVIDGGAFAGEFELTDGTINGGTFHNTVIGTSGSTINGGVFYGSTEADYIYAPAEFHDYVNATSEFGGIAFGVMTSPVAYGATLKSTASGEVYDTFNTTIEDGATLATGVWDGTSAIGPNSSLSMDLITTMNYVESSAAVLNPVVEGRFSVDAGAHWLYGPNSAWTAPANKVATGTSNLGTAGSLVVPSPRSSIGIGF